MRQLIGLVSFVLFITFNYYSCRDNNDQVENIKLLVNNNLKNINNYTDTLILECIFLPYHIIDTLTIKNSVNDKIGNLLNIQKLLYNLDFKSTIYNCHLLLNELIISDEDNILKAETIICLIKAKLELGDTQEQIINLEILNEIEFKNGFLNEYYHLRYLYYYQKYLTSQNKIYHSLSVIEYGIYKIYNSKYIRDLELLKGLFLLDKGSIVLNEKNNKSQITSYDCLESSIDIFNNKNAQNELTIAQINKANVNYKLEPNYLELLERKTLHSLNYISPFTKLYTLRNIGFLHYLENNLEKSLNLLKSGLNEFYSYKCTEFAMYIYADISYIYFEENKLDSATHYMNALKSFYNCNESTIEKLNFHLSELELMYYEKQYNNLGIRTEIDSIISPLFRRRNAAKKLFSDEKEFHLEDFYAENCIKILSRLNDHFGRKIPVKYQSQIIDLIHDTKNRELKRRKNISNKNYPNLNNKIENRINEILREIDDFNTMNDYANPIYEELYNLYNSLQNETNELNKSTNSSLKAVKKPQLDSLKSTLQENNSAVIEYIKYNNEYYSYYITQNSFELNEIDGKLVDSLTSQYINAITKKSNSINKIGSQLHELILPNEISKNKSIIFLPDGELSFLPFQPILNLKYPDTKCQTHFNIIDITSNKSTTLNKNKSAIFNYSSEKDIQDHKPKAYKELSFGLKECFNIDSIFNFTENIYTGNSFNKDVLESNLDKDIMHISTHAFSNSNKRQDCFLLLRQNNKPTKYYSTDLQNAQNAPKFVSLSACQTALGQYVSGSGIFSLSRAFLQNGSETVLKTLWDIDDQASMEFNIQFYENWNTGISVSDALFKTKQNFQRTKFNHPYYWAGFVLEGNPNLYLE